MSDKKPKSTGVKKVQEKYVCNECHSEVPVKQACPVCKKEIDWERVLGETYR